MHKNGGENSTYNAAKTGGGPPHIPSEQKEWTRALTNQLPAPLGSCRLTASVGLGPPENFPPSPLQLPKWAFGAKQKHMTTSVGHYPLTSAGSSTSVGQDPLTTSHSPPPVIRGVDHSPGTGVLIYQHHGNMKVIISQARSETQRISSGERNRAQIPKCILAGGGKMRVKQSRGANLS